MLRDKTDDRTIARFVTDVCAYGNWQLKFYVTKMDDVKDDPDVEPDERFTYEGDAREFIHEMRMRDDDVAALLDEKVMEIANDVQCDFTAEILMIDIVH